MLKKEQTVKTNSDNGFIRKPRKPKAHRIVDIYRNGGGEPIDMTKIDRKDPNRRKKILGLIIFILIILLGFTLAGFFIFSRAGDKFSEDKIGLEIVAPTKIASGDDVLYTIKYSNNENVALENVELSIMWPEGWRFQSSSPAPKNEAKNTWSIGRISAGSNDKVEIRGQIIGEVGTSKALAATLIYAPANFNSEFTKKVSHILVIASSIIDLNIEAPIRVISGKETEYKIKYKNNSEALMERLRVQSHFLEDFVVNSVEPKAKENNNLWEIDKLESGKEGEIKIKGIFIGSEGDMKEIKVEMGYVDADSNFHSQIEKSVLVLIINPQLTLTLTAGGSQTNGTADFGQNLDYSLKYQNDSEIDMKDLAISFTLTSEVLDWTSLIDTNKGEIKDNVITWTKNKIPKLATLKKGEGGEINFKIRVKSNITPTKESDKNYSIISRVRGVSGSITDLGGNALEVESNSITTKINTRLDLITEGRYYDDEYIKVGSGPVPPQVGQTTNYRIYWYLTNTSNEVKNVKVKTTLSKNIIWTGKSSVSAGQNLIFDPNTREVIWEINRVPPHTGQLFAGLEASFEVSATPNQEDLGLLLILTNKAELTATDDFTGAALAKSGEIITSELANDPQAKGKGIVVSGSTNNNLNVNGN